MFWSGLIFNDSTQKQNWIMQPVPADYGLPQIITTNDPGIAEYATDWKVEVIFDYDHTN